MMTASNGTNWKNVGNWHWVEKNVFPWAKEYLTKALTGLSTTQNDVTVSIDSVKDITGDVDLNQRKGKLITIYDVAITMNWKGFQGNHDVSGKIVIPELMHDTDMDELVFDITMENEKKEYEVIKSTVRTHLTKVIKESLKNFHSHVIETHQKDVYIAPEEMKGHPVLEAYKPKAPVSAVKSDTVSSGFVTIKQKVSFMASTMDIFSVLLDRDRVQMWTRSPAKISKDKGDFSLFDGAIFGTIIQVEEPRRIVMKWRLKSWMPDHFSTVTIDIDGDTLCMVQDGVPSSEKSLTEANWDKYYWNPIKMTFGY